MDREQKIEQFLKTSTSWRAAKDASGKVYYYDKKTRVTQWEKPDVLAEFERSLDGPAAPAAETQPATAAPAAADAAGTATAAVAAEKKDEQKPHFDKEIVGKYISALTPLTYSDVERSLFTADMSIFSVGDSAAATAAAAVIVEGVAAEVAAAEATPAESVSATACDVPVTQVVPKESAEAVVSSKDSILENNLISNVKVLVKHHGTSPVDMVSSLSNNYSGLPSKLKIMLEWLKLATALENQSPDQVDSVAEGALEEVLADMLKESFQSVRAEHRLLLQGAASAEGELPDCVLRFTGECAAAQRAVQSLARKYPDAVALRKWSEHIQLTTTAADAADGEQPSTGDVGAAVELLLLEGECLQPILLLLRKIIVKVFSSNGVCSDAVSKAGSESGGVDGGAAEGNALDNLLIDVCTIAGWSRALADEVAAALRGTLHSLRTSAQTSAAAVAEDKPVLQQQLLQGLAFTDEKLTAATKELQAVFSELIERLQEAAGKSLSLSDARSMQKSAQLLKKRTVLGALTVLKRCITDAGLPFRRDERVQTLLTTALQRSNAVGTTAASAAGLDSELSDDAVEDLAYMFPVALGSIMSGDDTEERSKNPLNWCYLCHPQLHRWFYELLLQRSSRKSCAQPEHVACMLSLSDTSDTLMTLIARCIKECVNSNGSSGDDSQQLAHPFHADAAACKSMWDAFQRAKTLCAELSDVLICSGPAEVPVEKRQALCNAISGSSAAAARYMVQWIRIYSIEMLPTLASEALYDAQRSFLQCILLAVVERQPAVAVDAFVALKNLMHADQPRYRGSLIEISSMSCYVDTANMMVLLHIMSKHESTAPLRYLLEHADHYQKSMVKYLIQQLVRRVNTPLTKMDAQLLLKLISTTRFAEQLRGELLSSEERHVLRFLMQNSPREQAEAAVPLL